MNTREALDVIEAAYVSLYDSKPEPVEARQLAALAWIETNYGMGWKGSGRGSNNWGAVQVSCKSDKPKFTSRDTHSDGTKYVACFRSYLTPVEGARDMIRIATKTPEEKAAFKSGSSKKIAEAMFKAGYYEGIGESPSIRIAGRAKLQAAGYNHVAKGLGMPPEEKEINSAAIVLGGVLVVVGALAAFKNWKG